MDTLKFNTFANSPKSLSPYPSKLPTQQSLSPAQKYPYFIYLSIYTSSIPQLKRQMQQAINSRRASRRSKKIHSKCPTKISLMKSDISLLSVPEIQLDLPLTMLELEVGVTEEILALREDKLTLMQEYNRILGDRYKAERELTKLKKIGERESSDINDLSIFENQNSSSKKKAEVNNETLNKNQALKSEYQYLEKQNQYSSGDYSKQQEERILVQIENFQQNSRILQQKISKIEENTRPEDDQRFQTFFPGKPLDQQPSEQTYFRLVAKKTSLLKQLARKLPKGEQKQYFLGLIQENQEFLEKLGRMEKPKRNMASLGIDYLREKVQEEQEAKSLFFQDLKRFKEQANRYRAQNQQLRSRLDL